MLTIYDKNGAVRCTVEPDSNSQQDKVLQGDNMLSLSFTLAEYAALDVNDYTDFEGERYWMTVQYRPKEKSSMEWTYDIQLFGIESMIKRFLVIHNTDSDPETVFTLTAPAIEHVRLIVQSINEGMGTEDWKVGAVTDTANLTVDYEGTYCDEGLGKVASAAETEWWIDGTTVNLCRCEHSEELTLRYGHEITSLERDNADGVKFYTRLFPLGSSRNIDRERYGHVRLQLPAGRKYVDAHVEEYGIIHHYEEQAFAHIYPRRVGKVSSVRQETVQGQDGNPFTIYYFKDNELPFDPNDYEIGGLVKHVVFQSGELDGRDFEVNYDSETQEFEIITVWPYDNDIQVPGGTLIPEVGDDYILWNIRMPDEYYGLAEQEFLAAVEAYNEKHAIDVSVYKCPTNHTWVELSQEDLSVGRRVRLESGEYFPETGYRSSRITRVTRKVTLPSQVDLEISDALSTGTMTKITDSIQDVRVYVRESSSNIPDVVRSTDSTPLNDNNILSARRSLQEFVNKKADDYAGGWISFLKGISVKLRSLFEQGLQIGANFISGRSNSGAEIDARGNGELESLIVRTLLSSPSFVDGLAGEGMRIWQDASGNWNAEVDSLTVRGTYRVYELLVQRIRSIGGQLLVSPASGTVAAAERVDLTQKGAVIDGWKITLDEGRSAGFAAGDLILCQQWTGTTNKRYWCNVIEVGTDGTMYINHKDSKLLIQNDDVWENCTEPVVGDHIVTCGALSNTDRQSAILIDATGHPKLSMYDGIASRTFAGALKTRLGYLGDVSDPHFGALTGHGLFSDNVFLKGTFMLRNGNSYISFGTGVLNVLQDSAGIVIEDGKVKLQGGEMWFTDADGKPYIKVKNDNNGTSFEFGYMHGNDWIACYDLGYRGLVQLANNTQRHYWGHTLLYGGFAIGDTISGRDVWLRNTDIPTAGGQVTGRQLDAYRYNSAYMLDSTGGVIWIPSHPRNAEQYDGTWWQSQDEADDTLPDGTAVNAGGRYALWYFASYTTNNTGSVRTYTVLKVLDGVVQSTMYMHVEKVGSGDNAEWYINEKDGGLIGYQTFTFLT